jgi:hypothetical protein
MLQGACRSVTCTPISAATWAVPAVLHSSQARTTRQMREVEADAQLALC